MDALSRERWQRIDALYSAALERPPELRDAFLREAAGPDAELYREVRALLDSDAAAERALDAPAAEVAELLAEAPAEPGGEPAESLPAGSRVGPYRIVEEIARGGMGAVYLAERADEEYEKRVALKLVKRGMDTDEILRRFRYERQILASLEHPHIARLLDGGATDDGRPYLVMEYIEGEPITRYCATHDLDVEARLELFEAVCRGVQHAHQKLVVHRDLKPSNILVTAEGEPKLLDFGIAKLLAEDAPDATPQTRTGVRVLTPEYASPEQLRGDPVTTATDVYQLGLLLYELLTGRRPFEGRADEAAAASPPAERDVPRPSSVVMQAAEATGPAEPRALVSPAAVANARASTPERLRRRLRGDLDTIVLKALDPEPTRRYASAQQLLDDVGRHLDGLPVLARPATLGYRAHKFVRRHRAPLATAALLLALVAGFSVLYTLRITHERNLARLEAERARATEQFVTSLFEGADPDAMQGDTLNVFELLDRGAERIEHGEMEDQPLVRASLENTLGTLYTRLGAYERGRPFLERALAARQALLDPSHEDVARGRADLAQLLFHVGDYQTADSLFAAATTPLRGTAGSAATLASILNSWGYMLVYAGRYTEAEPHFHEALALLRELPDDRRREIASSRHGLATLLLRTGEYDRAEAMFREVLALRRQLHGELHTETIPALEGVGSALVYKHQYDDAEPLLRRALELTRRLHGPDHPSVSLALNNLALVPYGRKDFAAADSLLRESLAIKETLGRDHRDIGMTRNNIAFIRMEAGDLDGAEAEFREALRIMRLASGAESDDAALLLGNLARVLQRKGDYGEAEQLFREALAVRIAVHGERSMQAAWRKTALAYLLREAGRLDEAEVLHRQSLELRRELQGEQHVETARGRNDLARVLLDQRRYAEAEPLLLASHAALLDASEAAARFVEDVVRNLLELYRATGDAASAARFEAMLSRRAAGD